MVWKFTVCKSLFITTFYEHYKESYSSLLLVQNCCDHFENFIQNLEKIYGDEEFMDEEILESLYENSFDHQQEIVASLLDENETKQDFNDDNRIPIPEVHESLQLSCQLLCDQERDQYSQSNGSLVLSISEVVCTENLDSKPIDDIEFQEDNEEVVVFSNLCEN